MAATTKQKPLTPPDTAQCQADIPNQNTFMTMGGTSPNRKYIRCTAKPTVIVHEMMAGKDGRRGAMSLCGDCLKVFKAQKGTPPVRVEPLGG
jgi:hypothetical protein